MTEVFGHENMVCIYFRWLYFIYILEDNYPLYTILKPDLNFCPTINETAVCVFQSGRFLTNLADDHRSSITKGSIYHTKHIPIYPFIMRVDWPEIQLLMEISVMFDICTYCIFTSYGTIIKGFFSAHTSYSSLGNRLWWI